MAGTYEAEASEKMEKSLEAFQHELMQVRTGRASAGLLDSIDVEVYGSKMKINQLGNVSIPDARLITITPWDKSQVGTIERAIQSSPLDLNPSNDGTVIRIPLPPLSEERRKELVKVVHKMAEEAKIAIRNVRRNYVDSIKKDQKNGDIPEDDAHKLTDVIQKITDEYSGKVDDALKAKEEEIMEV